MPRKPADSAYILACAARRVCRRKQAYLDFIKVYNENLGEANEVLTKNGLDPFIELPIEDCIFWHEILSEIHQMHAMADIISTIQDEDYRAILNSALKQPVNRVRQSKGFALLVPHLKTIRRYGPLKPNVEMAMTEEDARDLASLIWQQEMEPFISAGRGLDPINKQRIVSIVRRELAESNVKSLGEQVLEIEFNDQLLDEYEGNHSDFVDFMNTCIDNAATLFGYSSTATTAQNIADARVNIIMYNSILQKEMDDDELDILARDIVNVIQRLYNLLL